VGEEGHIAGLFPNHYLLDKKEKLYFFLNDAPKPPSQRITASPKIIKDANAVILLFVSESKKKAYENFMDKKISYKECPAKTALEAKEVYVFTAF